MVFHGTTILALRHMGKVIVSGDGQVTLNTTIVKHDELVKTQNQK